MRTWIELGPSLDVSRWVERHARGEVPDATPYGLDRLTGHGHRVSFRPTSTPPVTAASRAVRRVSGLQWPEALTTRPPRGTELALAWDERAGVPRAAISASRLAVATGVIWLDAPGAYRMQQRAIAALSRCALVWTLSAAQVPALVRLGVPASRVEHLLFGVDADFFTARGSDEVDPELVVSVGNDRHRDWGTLLAAFERVRRARPSARLEVVTRSPLPAADGVTVRAYVAHDELRNLYARAAVVALPTLPNLHVSGMTAALEAQATGRPVVLSDTPGARDYVDHDRTGWTVPVGDPEALAETLLTALAGGRSLVAGLGAAARLAVDTRHSTAHQAARLACLIDQHV